MFTEANLGRQSLLRGTAVPAPHPQGTLSLWVSRGKCILEHVPAIGCYFQVLAGDKPCLVRVCDGWGSHPRPRQRTSSGSSWGAGASQKKCPAPTEHVLHLSKTSLIWDVLDSHKEARELLPQVWPSIHEVEDLGRVQQLLESPEELHALVVPALGIDEDQQWACAGWGAGGLPEAWAGQGWGESPEGHGVTSRGSPQTQPRDQEISPPQQPAPREGGDPHPV